MHATSIGRSGTVLKAPATVPGSGQPSLIEYDSNGVPYFVARYISNPPTYSAPRRAIVNNSVTTGSRANDRLTLAADARYDITLTEEQVGFVGSGAGQRLRLRYKLLSGDPADFLVNSAYALDSGSSTVETVAFAIHGEFYQVEWTALPATTERLRIYLRNSSGGSALVTTIPEWEIGYGDWDEPNDNLTDLFGTDFTASAGATKSGTTMNVPAGTAAGAAQVSHVSIGAGAKTTVIVPGRSDVKRLSVEYRDGSDTYTGEMHWQDDAWRGYHTIAGDVAGTVSQIKLIVDNRDNQHTATDVAFDRIMVFPGHVRPARNITTGVDNQSRATNEIVVTQSSGEVSFYLPGSTGVRYLQIPVKRVDDASIAAHTWAVRGMRRCRRTGTHAFLPDDQPIYTGELTLALKQAGRADHMGGPTHGDVSDQNGGSATLTVDGATVSIDGATDYTASTASITTVGKLIDDNDHTTEIADITTTHAFDGATRKMTLSHLITWRVATTIDGACFLATLPISGDSTYGTVARRSPAFADEDISGSTHTEITDDADEIRIRGTDGFSADMKVTRGWNIDSGKNATVSDQGGDDKKVYFAVVGDDYAVAVDDVWDFACEYTLDILPEGTSTV